MMGTWGWILLAFLGIVLGVFNVDQVAAWLGMA